MDGLCVGGYEKDRVEERGCTKSFNLACWDHEKPSNPCEHGKIDVKLMMMMMIMMIK